MLCFFFGYFGLHNFYVGKIGSGLFQLGLLVFVVFCVGSSIVPMLSGIMYGYTSFDAQVYVGGLIASSMLSFWIFIDFIFILCGAFRDKSKRRVDRW